MSNFHIRIALDTVMFKRGNHLLQNSEREDDYLKFRVLLGSSLIINMLLFVITLASLIILCRRGRRTDWPKQTTKNLSSQVATDIDFTTKVGKGKDVGLHACFKD